MDHPFVVGSSYANNLGAYTVLKIESTNMHVRYADGHETMLQLALQARIWARLCMEAREAARPPVVRRTVRRRTGSAAKS